MDEKTLDYYSQNAPDVFKRYDSVQDGIEKYFKETFPQKGHILNIGAGSGRDVRYLIQDGHKAYGLEPCDKLRSIAIHKYPKLSSFLLKGRIPDDFAMIRTTYGRPICIFVILDEYTINSGRTVVWDTDLRFLRLLFMKLQLCMCNNKWGQVRVPTEGDDKRIY